MKKIIEQNNFFDIIRNTIKEGECIVEIGAGTGETTIELCKIAKEKKAIVYVIDPFDNEMPPSYVYNYAQFLDKVKDYKENYILLKNTSLSKVAEGLLEGMNIGFVFIDGLQYRGAILNDLRITEHAKIVCLDDFNRESPTSEVPSTLNMYIKTSTKQLIIKERWAYLIK